MSDQVKNLKDKAGNRIFPVTHINAVRNSAGDSLPDILDRDYPTTSKTAVEDSSEVSLCTRGEKYEWNKVGNATDITGASDITTNFKHLLLNGDTGEFELALKNYVEESVRAALGALVNNLDKGTSVSTLLATDANNDLGSVTPSNLASLLGVPFIYSVGDIANSLNEPPVSESRKVSIGLVGEQSTHNSDFYSGVIISFWVPASLSEANLGESRLQLNIIHDSYGNFSQIRYRSRNGRNGSWTGWTKL